MLQPRARPYNPSGPLCRGRILRRVKTMQGGVAAQTPKGDICTAHLVLRLFRSVSQAVNTGWAAANEHKSDEVYAFTGCS